MNDLIEDLPEEVVNLMLMFFERTQGQLLSSDAFDGALEDKCSRICNFFKERICWWTRLMNDIATGSSQSSTELDESELGVLWGIICCYHHFLGLAANPSVMMNFINALDLFLTIEAGKVFKMQLVIPELTRFESIEEWIVSNSIVLSWSCKHRKLQFFFNICEPTNYFTCHNLNLTLVSAALSIDSYNDFRYKGFWEKKFHLIWFPIYSLL